MAEPRFLVLVVERESREVVHTSSPLTSRMAIEVYESMSVDADHMIEFREIDQKGDRHDHH